MSEHIDMIVSLREENAVLKERLERAEADLAVAHSRLEEEMRRAGDKDRHALSAWRERDDLRYRLERCTAERDHARQEWYAWMKLAVGNGVSLGVGHMPKVEGVDEVPAVAEKE